MGPPWLPRALEPMAHLTAGRAGAAISRFVAAIARHTGIPAVLVAAVALVLAYRLARRSLHLVVEVTLAFALVLAATKAGWLRF
jgi:hypothetical protein